MNFHFKTAPPLAVMAFALALPVHAETAALELEYKSAFDGYQAYKETEIKDWPVVNQMVSEIGGWRVYAREPGQEIPSEKAADMPKYGEPAEPHHHGGRP
jgi:hypothetical protein